MALTLIFAFMPFVAERMAMRNRDAKMYAATNKIDVAQTAARIYIRENANNIKYNQTVVSGNDLVDLLEPYGLPLGFVPKTALGQDIELVISKDDVSVSGYLRISGGNLTKMQIAELARRVGFYAMPDGDTILVGIALDNTYTDVVKRNETNSAENPFFTDLDMGGFSLNGIGNTIGRRGEFAGAQIGTLSVSGDESGHKSRNKITSINANRTVFQTKTGESALSLTRGVLSAKSVSGRTISKFGTAGDFVSNVASVYDFSLSAGSANFNGPSKWTVRGNLVSSKISFGVERLDVASYVNATRGQDVYINNDTLEYTARSGIESNVIAASNITLRDQTSTSLLNGGSGAIIFDLRPAGTSVMPDVLIKSIDNDKFDIIATPSANDDKTIDCKSVIEGIGGVYNKQSLAQNTICQYVFWQRLEQRIDIKQCLLSGKSNCV